VIKTVTHQKLNEDAPDKYIAGYFSDIIKYSSKED
jgi:hypothetical protein